MLIGKEEEFTDSVAKAHLKSGSALDDVQTTPPLAPTE
jgi:hypothetical protein